MASRATVAGGGPGGPTAPGQVLVEVIPQKPRGRPTGDGCWPETTSGARPGPLPALFLAWPVPQSIPQILGREGGRLSTTLDPEELLSGCLWN